MKRLGHIKQAGEVQAIAQTVVLSPDAVNDYTALLEATAKLDVRALRGRWPWDVHAACLLRAGKVDEAAERLDRSLRTNPSMQTPWNRLLLALVRQRQGKTREAAKGLQEATASLDLAKKPPAELRRQRVLPWQRLTWQERVELMLLRREAEDAIRVDPAPPPESKPSTEK